MQVVKLSDKDVFALVAKLLAVDFILLVAWIIAGGQQAQVNLFFASIFDVHIHLV
jgi:hypothetical protein